MIDASQMREVITDTLNALGSKYADPKAIELVYNTGLVESKYVYIKQIKGPARGFFQCEPHNAVDICANYLKYRESLMKKVAEVCMLDWKYFTNPNEDSWREILTNNLSAQILFCRLHYRRVPKPLPRTLENQAVYWKQYYNTAKGAGTPQHFAEIVSKYG
jgi:hypothetical protein|tara:strand:- start:143 stop:625 length:483 start_codon:yes stop_codon:yes gene_type:complete